MVSFRSILEDEKKALKALKYILKVETRGPYKGEGPQRLLGLIGQETFLRTLNLETFGFVDFKTPKGNIGEIKVSTFPRREEGIFLKFYSNEVRSLQRSKKQVFVVLWVPLSLHVERVKLLLENKETPFFPIEFEVVGLMKKREVLKEIERDPNSKKYGLWVSEDKLTKIKDKEELLRLLDD